MRAHSKLTLVAGAAVIALVASGCTAGGGGGDGPKKKEATIAEGASIDYTAWGADYPTTSTKDVPGDCSWNSTSMKDYSGQTLKVITHAVPVIGEPTVLHAKQFEELTGAKVDVVNVPFGELYQKILTPLQANQAAYDVMFYPSLWIGDLHNYLAPVPQKYLDTAEMKDVTAAYTDVATWDGKMVQYPIDGDRHFLKVRSDALANPEVQAKYEAATGAKAEIPKTWDEYQALAQVLTGWDWAGDGRENFGSAEVTKRDDLMFSAYISRAAAFAKNPNVTGGFFFDLETMKPQINNPGFVKGLDALVAAKSTWPPGGSNFGLGDEILSFGGGQTGMSYSWDDAFIQAQQPDSAIRNKVVAAQLPGADQVWNRLTNKWDKVDTINQPAYFAWGWTSAVAEKSPRQQMAFDFLCFFSNTANATLDLQIGRFGINPYRSAQFGDASFWKGQGWSDESANSYVTTLANMEKNPNKVFDLRVPGVGQYMSALASGVAAAIAGEKTSQAALDDVAVEWASITEQIGVDKVRNAYANVVKLEDAR